MFAPHYGGFFKDSRDILIIYFRLLLKTCTLNSIGHDLLKEIKRNLLVMEDTNFVIFICLLTHLHTGFLLVHSVCFFIQPSVAMRWDTSMTLVTSLWNGAVSEVSSCVINNVLLDHVSYYWEHFWNTFIC